MQRAAVSDPTLAGLARERRSLHAEGLLAAATSLALAAAGDLPPLALVPLGLLVGASSLGWVVRFVALLGRPCPRCGGLFFYSLDRLLYSLPYLSARCAQCRQPLRQRRLRPR